MSEYILELYSEEVPPSLQVSAKSQLEEYLSKELTSAGVKFKKLQLFSTPTRLTVFITGLSKKIKIPELEIRGPKEGVENTIVENFAKSKNVNIQNLYKKKLRVYLNKFR